MLFLIHKELFLKFDEWTLQAEGWLPTVSRKPFGTLVVTSSGNEPTLPRSLNEGLR